MARRLVEGMPGQWYSQTFQRYSSGMPVEDKSGCHKVTVTDVTDKAAQDVNWSSLLFRSLGHLRASGD